MLPKTHLVLTLIFSAILIFFELINPFQALIIIAAGFFIDVDHWFIYVINKKDLNVRRAFNWFYKAYLKQCREGIINKRKRLYVFHTIESFIVIILLSFLNPFFIYVLIGALFHLFLDTIHSIYRGFYLKKISLIYFLIKGGKNGWRNL
ncbi:hypothetical protein ACFLZZ_01580 [Nanoarchaeota archaeon]